MSQEDVTKIYYDMLIELNEHIYKANGKDNAAMENFRLKLKGKREPPAFTNLDPFSDICEKLYSKSKIIVDFRLKVCDFGILKDCIDDQSSLDIIHDAENKILKNMGKQCKPPLSLKLPTEETQKPSPEEQSLLSPTIPVQPGAEEKRRVEDVSLAYSTMEAIIGNKIHLRIGRLEVVQEDQKSFGTGFRVGKMKFMTAYHILKDVIENIWKSIATSLSSLSQNDIQRIVQEVLSLADLSDYKEGLGKCKDAESLCKFSRKTGQWWQGGLNVSIILKALNEIGHSALAQYIETMVIQKFDASVEIKFGFTRHRPQSALGQEHRPIFHLHYDILYGSKEDDLLIMGLKPVPDEDESTNYGFLLTKEKKPIMQIAGHPDGSILRLDPQVGFIKSSKDLQTLKDHATDHWKKYFPHLEEKTIKNDYEDCKFNDQTGLFHCSQSVTHGASGSPGFSITEDCIPVVHVMLQAGYPNFFYNHLSKVEQRSLDVNPVHLIEKGLMMGRVSELLTERKLVDLREELFKSPTQAVLNRRFMY